ncbi:MAG: hypothetical protein R6U61_06090 [Thermoplasmata archaeon]
MSKYILSDHMSKDGIKRKAFDFLKKIERTILPGKKNAKWFILFSGEHPLLFKFLSVLFTSLIVLAVVLSSWYSASDYFSYLPDDDVMNVSTEEFGHSLEAYELMDHVGLYHFFSSPIDWKLESNNPSGRISNENYNGTVNITQFHSTLKFTFNVNVTNDSLSSSSPQDERDIMQNFLTYQLGYNLTLNDYQDTYGNVSGDTVITCDLKEEGDRPVFFMNMYHRNSRYGRVVNIIKKLEDRSELDHDRYNYIRLTETTPKQTNHAVGSSKFKYYWNLDSGELTSDTNQYIHEIFQPLLLSKPKDFDRWADKHEVSQKMDDISSDGFVELVDTYTSERFSSDSEAVCVDYTREYIKAFYYTKYRWKNSSVESLHAFPVSSSVMTPVTSDQTQRVGHRYVGILSINKKHLHFSFIDPLQSDKKFPSFQSFISPLKRDRLDAYDDYHHISLENSKELEEIMDIHKMDVVIKYSIFSTVILIIVAYRIRIRKLIRAVEQG